MTVRMPLIALLLVAGVVLAGAVRIDAATPQASSLILFRSPQSQTREPGVVHLWTTDGHGQHAREILALKPTSESDPLRGAYLVPDGIIVATTDPKDGNNADLGFVKRGSTRIRKLFVVRGLYSLQPSPDGKLIAYSRQLPVAGKPLFVIARQDGTIIRTLSHNASPIFSWSADGQRLFSYCHTVRRRELCSYSATTGTSTATNLNLQNAASTPSVSPSGTKVAFYEKLGPAGERIYTAKGAFLRNLVGQGTAAIWSPDESKLLLQGTGDPLVFSFKTKRLTPFAHNGPANLFVLDWR
jgi:Tol biopolymer transport system component